MNQEVTRVLQIIRSMNIAGAETFIMNVYRNIDRKKVQFDFLVSNDGEYDEEIKKLGGKIYKIPYLTEIGQKRYVRKLKEFFISNPEYKVIHSHIDQVSGIILETANKCKVPVRIAHSHSTKNSNGIFGKIYKAYLQNKINDNANIKLACGEDAAKWLYKKDAKKAIIVNNGINIEDFLFSESNRKKIRETLQIPENTIVLGHIGRFSEVKNHDFLIDVFNEYQKKNSAVLLLIGEGEQKEKIENKVKNLNLQNKVKFLGTRKDANKFYSAFDILLLPSLYEGLSTVSIEAQCNGLKILASNTIDKNTDITGNIYLESLLKTAEDWAEKIDTMDLKRTDVKNRLQNSGYDIKDISKKMEHLYLNGV